MKRRTTRLVLSASILYGIVLLIFSIVLQDQYTASLSLLVGPLAILMIALLRDFRDRAIEPSKAKVPPSYLDETRQIEFLTKQVQVASESSYEYLDSTILKRLRQILAEKVSLETGVDSETAEKVLMDPEEGPRLLGDEALHRSLYAKPQDEKPASLRVLGEIIDRIRTWKL